MMIYPEDKLILALVVVPELKAFSGSSQKHEETIPFQSAGICKRPLVYTGHEEKLFET